MKDSYRVGLGTDLHRLGQGRPLIIGGVEITSDVGAIGHSDADTLLHAVADALLGAVAGGDVGEHFPDDAPENMDLDSRKIVEGAMSRVGERGYVPVQIDAVVDLERPRILPHRERIRASLAQLLGLPIDCVSLKAKTGEGVGPIGRGEAIAAQVVVLLARKTSDPAG